MNLATPNIFFIIRILLSLRYRIRCHLLILQLLLWIPLILSGQGVQKTIDINLDSRSINTTLPYNQNLLFRIKSKEVDLSKVGAVMILEHKGRKNVQESIRGYKTEKRLQWHFYDLDKKYNLKDSLLEVFLMKDSRDELSGITEPPYVLFPARQYSLLFFVGRTLTSDEKTFMAQVRKYVEDSLTGAASLPTSQKAVVDEMIAIKKNAITEWGFFGADILNLNTLAKVYYENVYDLDTKLNQAETDWSTFMAKRPKLAPITNVYIPDILLKAMRDTGNHCLKKYLCDAPACKLYEAIKASRHLGNCRTLDDLLVGQYALTDIDNIFFVPESDPNLGKRMAYLDSTLKQSLLIKNLVQQLLLDNTSIDDNGEIYKEYNACFPAIVYDQLNKYSTPLDGFIKEVGQARRLISNIQTLQRKISDFYVKRSIFFDVLVSSADTYVYSFETRSNYSIIPVFGYAIYGFQKGFTSFTPYTGLIFGFQHLDEEVPFRLLKKKRFFQRVSFTTALTLSSLREDGKRYDFFSNGSSFMTGFGFKFSHVVTFNGGALWFKKEDPNPFITSKKVTVTPYTSISLNLKLKKLFEGFTSLIPLK